MNQIRRPTTNTFSWTLTAWYSTGSYIETVNINLNALDNDRWSGIDKTYYAIGTNTWTLEYTIYSWSIIINGLRDYTLNYYSVDVFGKESIISWSDVGNTILFTWREYDKEIGLYYFRARYYDAELGRFINRDPIGQVDDVNLYGYVGNNSVMFVDPFWKKKVFVETYDKYIELKELIFNKGDLDPRFYFLDKNTQDTLKNNYKYYKNEVQRLHYNRNTFNTNLPTNLSDANQKQWLELSYIKSWYHQETASLFYPNHKYISQDRKKEVVFDSDWIVISDISDVWTYNFFDPLEEPWLHKKYDVDPYYEFWNGFNDSKSPLERITWF